MAKFPNIFSTGVLRKTISAALFIIGLSLAFGVGANIAQATAPACPLVQQQNRTIVNLGDGLWSTNNMRGPYSTSISAGIYDVTIVTWDSHSSKPYTQINERVFVGLRNSSGGQFATTNITDDLPDLDDWLTQKVNTNLVISEDVASVMAYHADYPNNASSSIYPICVAFDLQAQGCTDSLAINYEPLATIDDGSCDFLGCTDPAAVNFDPIATIDDESCITVDLFPGCTDPIAINYDPQAVQDNESCEYYQCSDGLDNDGDLWIDDFDPTCHTDGDPTNPDSYDPTIDDENSAPVIALVGNDPVNVNQGDTYTDAHATANDEEDGNITADIVVGGDVVDSSTLGGYTITYNVQDSEGVSATEVTRVVNIVPVIVDYPGCTDPAANNYNPQATQNDGSCSYGCVVNCGGGGGEVIRLEIVNEKVEHTATSTVVVTWNTNLQATSQVFYGTDSHATATLPFSEYMLNIPVDSTYRYEHSMTITGLDHGITYYLRPMSTRTNEEAGGKELDIILPGTPKPPVCEEYLLEYIKLGEDNNSEEVTKLQIFLRDFEGFTELPVTGIYDQVTYDAVSEFQARYGDDVLTPWTHVSPTGYVYITTKKKINEIYCQREFPLSAEQEGEIEDFKILLESLQARQEAGEEVEEEIEEASGRVGQIEEETILALLEERNQGGGEAQAEQKNEAVAETEVEQTFGEIAAALAPIITGLELPENTGSEESDQREENKPNLFQGAMAFAAGNENVLTGMMILIVLLTIVCGAQVILLRRMKNGN